MKKKMLKELPELLVTPAIKDAEKRDKLKTYTGYGEPVKAVEYPRLLPGSSTRGYPAGGTFYTRFYPVRQPAAVHNLY